jgi:hypothetical protein
MINLKNKDIEMAQHQNWNENLGTKIKPQGKYLRYYRVFHRFREAKFDNSGSILSWSQFSPLSQLPQKMKLTSKVVKIDSK